MLEEIRDQLIKLTRQIEDHLRDHKPEFVRVSLLEPEDEPFEKTWTMEHDIKREAYNVSRK